MRIQLIQNLICILITSVTFNAWGVTLSEAIESAMSVDPTLRASKLNLLAAEENIAMARSRLLPQVSLQGTTSQLTQTTSQEVTGGADISRSFTGPSANHQIVIRQALYRPKEFSNLNLIELQNELIKIKYKQDIEDLRSRVINAWIDLLGSKKIVQITEKPLKLIEKSVAQEKAKYLNGDSTNDVVIEAEAQYQNALAMWKQAIEVFNAKKNHFERLTRLSLENASIQDLVIAPEYFVLESQKYLIFNKNLSLSNDLKVAKIQEEIQLEKIKGASSESKPTLDLIANFGVAKNDATSTQGYKYKNKQFGIQYNIPVFTGDFASAITRQASLGYQASLVESEAQFIRFENEFNNNWSQLIGIGLRLEASKDYVIAAQILLNSNIRGFELGVKSITDISMAESTLAKRSVEHIMLLQDYLRYMQKINITTF
jgi:outer membrane protein TolC